MASTLPSTMRAAVFGPISSGIDKSTTFSTDVPLPKTAKQLKDGQTLVKVAYSSLNPVDYKIAEVGLARRFVYNNPGITGSDYAGTVVESTLAHLKPGEEVFGISGLPNFGALAEYLVVDKKGVVPVPNGVSLEDASTLGVASITAYQTLEPFVKEGDKVLINGGSGGVGVYTIQIAKLLGCHVTATCSGPNVDLCKSLGADEVIDYRTEPIVEYLKRSGKQFDLIIDNVFADSNLYWQSHHYLKPSAKFVTIAGSPSLGFVTSLLKILLLPSWLGGGQREFKMIAAAENVEQWTRIAGWLKEGKLKSVIEKIYPLEETDQAFTRLKSGRVRGKLIVKI